MSNGFQSFLHMDGEWMWRFYLLDSSGKVLAISAKAYFTREEAAGAVRAFQSSFVMA